MVGCSSQRVRVDRDQAKALAFLRGHKCKLFAPHIQAAITDSQVRQERPTNPLYHHLIAWFITYRYTISGVQLVQDKIPFVS
jgi:hypothetical protein